MLLKNKKILFFGTDNEISSSILQHLVSLEAQIFFVSHHDFDELIESDQENYKHIKANYYSLENIENLFSTSLKNEINFDGLVFGGGKGGVRPVKLNKSDFVQNMFQANVFSLMQIMRFAVRKDFMNNGASIVALSSVSSIKGLKSKTAYSASKAALEAVVRGAAAELADRKIRVNAIQKGWVTSDMNLDFIQDNRNLNDDDDFKKQILGAIEPSELANLVGFLLSDQVKTITGTSVLLDGGYTL